MDPKGYQFEGRVLLENKLGRRRFPPWTPDLLQGRNYAHGLRHSLHLWDLAAPEVTIPLFVAVFRAAMGDCDFGIHLAGPTGTGKTTLAYLATAHFGTNLGARDATNFESTPNSVEAEAFRLKDQAILVDDYLGTPEHRKVLEAIGRSGGNLSGRGRMGSDLSVRGDMPARALVITTGEDMPVGKSLNARMLTLRLGEAQGLDFTRDAPINIAQELAQKGVFAQAMGAFIAFLAESGHKPLYSMLQTLRDRYSYKLPDEVTHQRTRAIYGDLMVGLEFLLQFAELFGALSEEERAEKQDQAEKAIKATILDQGGYQSAADSNELFLELLNQAIATGEAHVRPPNNSPKDYSGKHLGWVLEDGVFLYPGETVAFVKEIAVKMNQPIANSPQDLYSRFAEKGWLASTNLEKKRRGVAVRKIVTEGGEQETFLHFRSELITVPEASPSKKKESK
jgi:hypothetical protein